ncbi:hypothetical protein EUTSA_v10026466mg [Eutrema salsugineum]|uniref:Uncharacterized protein n=1 Tax=Eutrema salsugineum TaxID=72664 RepID=V4MEE5_EUTSA|nr:uncharacterized protein LOC18029847 [Eutrema salsugineum]ESQ54849.1 hypothetical protein EUTSA_v10026466mg [Eutrema salsugineum]
MRKKREAKEEKDEEEKKKRVELMKAAAQAWLSHSQTSKSTVLELEAQRRKHAFVKGRASRFKMEAMSTTCTSHHHHPSFLDWEFGQSLWDPYEILSVSKKLERELTLEEHTLSSENGIIKKKKKDSRNSLRSLFTRSSSRRFKQTHDAITPSNL